MASGREACGSSFITLLAEYDAGVNVSGHEEPYAGIISAAWPAAGLWLVYFEV
jgi:hypothetical protein